ncbi:TIGR02147 family protein [Bdellovibrio sp. HCB290]|uniref:TIGR02147 family protein n=1 Tax=Bdellovibrio sp. HCB290 TaxID=3394356 RepID=UPI0039B394BF
MLKSRPNIFEFVDYRQYITVFFEYKKSQNPRFSYDFVAKRLGTSRAYLKNISIGRRHIHLDKIPALAKVFDLSQLEIEYFLMAVAKSTVKNTEVDEYFGRIMDALKAQNYLSTKYIAPAMDGKGIYINNNWLGSVIHEMSRLEGFKFDSQKILSQLVDHEDITIENVEKIMKELLELGMIVLKEDGVVQHVPVEQSMLPQSHQESLKSFRVSIEKSYSILNDAAKYRPLRFFAGCLAVNFADFDKIHREFCLYHDKVVEISKTSVNPDHIVYLSDCFFNVTKKEQAEPT